MSIFVFALSVEEDSAFSPLVISVKAIITQDAFLLKFRVLQIIVAILENIAIKQKIKPKVFSVANMLLEIISKPVVFLLKIYELFEVCCIISLYLIPRSIPRIKEESMCDTSSITPKVTLL